MKKIIIIVILFVISLASLEYWGMNTGSVGMVALTAFLAGLFIGQRRARRNRRT